MHIHYTLMCAGCSDERPSSPCHSPADGFLSAAPPLVSGMAELIAYAPTLGWSVVPHDGMSGKKFLSFCPDCVSQGRPAAHGAGAYVYAMIHCVDPRHTPPHRLVSWPKDSGHTLYDLFHKITSRVFGDGYPPWEAVDATALKARCRRCVEEKGLSDEEVASRRTALGQYGNLALDVA